jgi:Zn-dependent protease
MGWRAGLGVNEQEPMNPSSHTDRIQLARVIGIPIYLHFSWLIIFALIVWTLSTGYFPARYPNLPASSAWANGLVASLLFFVSILLHELGHAAVGLRRHFCVHVP